MSASALPGFRDFFPEDFARRAWLFERWRDVAHRFGYVEYDGPPLEPLELYTRKSGEEIVGQLYNFVDKGGRAVAMRPEMTPSVARMVGSRANSLRKPVRWFSIPQLFRYERQQKGRLREHFQLNVDIFGEADVAADAELVAVACEVMRACGLGPGDVAARVSDRRLLAALLGACGVAESQLSAAFAAIDKVARDEKPALIRRMGTAGIEAGIAEEVLALVVESDFAALRKRFSGSSEVVSALDRMDRYLGLTEAHGVGSYIRLDLTIVRGLAYYTGIVFELFDIKGDLRAICGGGRYDSLLSALGGTDMPALGFGMGDVVLGELLRQRTSDDASQGVDVWVVPGAEGVSAREVVRTAAALRRLGISASNVLSESRLESQKARDQMSAAGRAGARHVVLLHPGDQAATMRSLDKDDGREGAARSQAIHLPSLLEAADAGHYARHLESRGIHEDGVLSLLVNKGLAARGSTDQP
ncbi:MAG: ATP phosphoribosyltransferase regulatory subunit [Gemmatimonadota bacterium]